MELAPVGAEEAAKIAQSIANAPPESIDLAKKMIGIE